MNCIRAPDLGEPLPGFTNTEPSSSLTQIIVEFQ